MKIFCRRSGCRSPACFGGSPEVWIRLQAAYDLKKSEQNKKVMARVARIVPVKPVEEVRA
jgi:plasmid maintenance system antidote protein VapI